MASDWIKLHRKSLDSRVFSDPFLWQLWCWCLMKANWKRGWKLSREIPPGSFATGELSAAEQLNVSGSKWRRGIKKLQEFGMVEAKATNRFTVISVVNWAKYQDERRTGDEPVTNQRRTGDEPVTTIEEGKKGRREETPSHTQADGFEKEWQSWLDFREAIDGRPLDPIRADSELMELARRSPEKAASDIAFSIRKGAKSILDSDNDFQKRNGTRQRGKKELNF